MIKITCIGRIGLESRCFTTQLNLRAEDLREGTIIGMFEKRESPEWLKHHSEREGREMRSARKAGT